MKLLIKNQIYKIDNSLVNKTIIICLCQRNLFVKFSYRNNKF